MDSSLLDLLLLTACDDDQEEDDKLLPLILAATICERASCYARANLPRTVPKSYWSWPVAICEGSVPTCTVVSPNTMEVHVPRRLYACPMKTEVPD